MTSENPFDSQAESYEEWFRVNDKLFESELEAVRTVMPRKGTGIEIGVGTGLFASALGIGYGVEPSSQMADKARNRGIKVYEGTAERLPCKDQTYDHALMVTADCFLDDVQQAFNEIWRILKNNGSFVIAFLDRGSPLGEVYDINKNTSDVYRNAEFHSADEIKSLLERAGFTVTGSVQTVFSLDNVKQDVKEGTGEGVFAVFRAAKKHDGHHHGHNNIKIAFFLNLSFTVIEIIGGVLTNSIAILSDALHDLGDSLSLGIAWYLEKYSKKKPDSRYTYGYARFSLLGALINGIILTVGSVLILLRAIPRLWAPEAVDVNGMLILAVLGISVNGIAALRLVRSTSLNEKIVSWHLLEDVFGWAAVLVAGAVMKFVYVPVLDTILSILITMFVLFNVAKNLREVFQILLQRVPEDITISAVEEAVSGIPGVGAVHHTHIWSLEGERSLLSMHVIVPDEIPAAQLSELKRNIRETMKNRGIDHVTIEIDFESEGCNDLSCF